MLFNQKGGRILPAFKNKEGWVFARIRTEKIDWIRGRAVDSYLRAGVVVWALARRDLGSVAHNLAIRHKANDLRVRFADVLFELRMIQQRNRGSLGPADPAHLNQAFSLTHFHSDRFFQRSLQRQSSPKLARSNFASWSSRRHEFSERR
jgi:hypothetical protein